VTVIGYPKLFRADASDALALCIQTRQPAPNRRSPRPDICFAPPGLDPLMPAGLETADMRQKVDLQLTGDISAQVGN
jgi:hypothetical protein